MNCAWFEMLSRVPFASLRLSLCRWHVRNCPRCLQASESDELFPPILVTSDRLAPGLDLWPGVQQGIDVLPRPDAGSTALPLPTRRSWRWAYAAAGILLLLGAGFWALFKDGSSGPPVPIPVRPPAEQPRLCSAKIADKPAKVFQVQSRNPDRIIFWIAKGENRS